MKLLLPLLAVFCFSLAGVGCKSACCGSCGGHSHAEKCCGKCGGAAKACPAGCTKECCAKKAE